MNLHHPEPARFTACPSYRTGETAQSYLGRLTAFFGSPSPKEFCKDYLLDLRGIQHGESEALQRLAAMTGADPDELVRSTPQRIDKAFMVLNGEMLHTRVNPRHRISICPLCAREDIAANPGIPLDQAVYGRREWMVGVVDCCVRHGVRLVSHRAPIRTAEKIDVGYETAYLLEELDRIRPEPVTADDFQLYALSRIGSLPRRRSPLLDDLPLVVATQLCHAAGLDVLRHRQRDGEGDDTARRAAGFDLLGHGIDGFEASFIGMREGLRLSEMTSHLLPRLLEYLHKTQHSSRDLEGFKDALADVFFRNLPYAKGMVILGRRCPRRHLFDFPGAMSAYGIGRHHLHAFVLGTPDLAAYVGQRRQDSLIRVDVADRLFVGRVPFLSGKEASRKLGWEVTDPRLSLYPILDAVGFGPASGASTAEIRPIYSEPALDAAMRAFYARFEIVDAAASGLSDTHEVSKSIGISTADLWQLLALGKIRRLGLVTEQGWVRGMRIFIADVLEAATGAVDPLNTNQVATLLGVSPGKVRNLVDHGHLNAVPMPPHLSSKISVVFARETADAFAARYLSALQVKAMLPASSSLAALAGIGLRPAIVLEGQSEAYSRTIFFDRRSVERLTTT